ncbi:MAG: hypothetical protein Q7N50_03630 [Armatimonadota bacterium]|nr:hypothetical protein [Armatimonadota bacterium]
MRRTAIYTLLLFSLLIEFPSNTFALNFRSSLDSIKVEGRPGQLVNRSFQMTIDKQEERTYFRADLDDWWHSEDGKQSFYREPGTPGTPSRSCASWVKLNPVEAAVDPGGTLIIRVSISIPADVKPGGYWCALTVDELPNPMAIRPEGVGMRFYASISTGIFVYISPVNRSAQIMDVRILPNSATVKLRNDGNSPLGIEGRFEFVKPGDSKPAAVALIPRSTLLPEPINTGILSAMLPDASVLPSGRYLVRAVLDIGVDHYIGAQKEMDVDRGTPSTPQTK